MADEWNSPPHFHFLFFGGVHVKEERTKECKCDDERESLIFQ